MLTLSSHLYRGLESELFPSGLSVQNVYTFLACIMCDGRFVHVKGSCSVQSTLDSD